MEYSISVKRTIFILAALAVILRLIGLDKSFQGDEFFSIVDAGSLKNIPFALLSDTHPPLYFYLLHFWMKISMNEAFLRLLSVVPGVGICIVTYFIGKEAFGTGVGIAASLLTAAAPGAVWSSQYIRTYSLATFFTVVSVYFLIKLIKSGDGSKLSWAFFVLSAAASLYTFYFSALFIVAENIFVLLFMRCNRPFVRNWIFAQLAIAAFYIPWLPFFIYQRSSYLGHPQMVGAAGFYAGALHVGGIIRGVAGLAGMDPRFFAREAVSASAILKTISAISVSAGIVFAVWLASGYSRTLKEAVERRVFYLFLLLSALPFAIALALHQTMKIIIMSHYLLASFVFIALLTAAIAGRILSRKIRIVLLVLILFIYASRLIWLYTDKEMDFKGARDYITKATPRGAAIVSPSFGGIFDHYFSDIQKRYHMEDAAAFRISDEEIWVVSYPEKLELKGLDDRFRKSLASRHYSRKTSERFGDLVVERYGRVPLTRPQTTDQRPQTL